MAALASAPASEGPARPSRSLGLRLARFAAWHPEWWVYVVAGASAVLLVLISVGPASGGPAVEHHMHPGMPGMSMPSESESSVAAWSSALGHWALMVGAMMLPVAAPYARVVAVRSLWSRRHRSAGLFLVGYLALWLLAGALLLVVLVPLGAPPLDWPWVVAALVVAAVWQVSGPRKRVLRRCGSLRLGIAAGIAADLDCTRAGLRSGLRCMLTCWPAMLAMAMSHHLLLMAGLLAVMLTERARGANPMRRGGRPLEAWVLAGFALVAGAAATIQ